MNLEFAPWIEDPDPPDHLTEKQLTDLVHGAVTLMAKKKAGLLDFNPYHVSSGEHGGEFTTGSGGGGGGEKSSGEKTSGEHPGKGYSAEARVDAKGVIHTSNVDDAARALFEDRKVELSQPDQVSTLIMKLGDVAKDMVAKGEKAPVFNLCNVSVAGTNLFCAESVGIPRVKMPQLTDEQTKDFHEYLAGQGHNVTLGSEFASHLRATQDELNGAKVASAAKLIQTNESYAGRRIIVSRDNYILDGHHFWAGKVALDAADGNLTNDTKIRITRIDISIIKLLEEADKFTGGKGRKGVGDASPHWTKGEHGLFTGSESSGRLEREKQIADIAVRLGYDPNKIKFVDSEKTIIDGREYEVAAGFKNFSGGQITVNSKDTNQEYMTGVLAHEIGHAKFEIAETQFSNQRMDMFTEQHPELNRDQVMLKLAMEEPLPKVTSPDKYPVYAKLEPYFRDVKNMVRGQNVSDYAKLYWNEWRTKGAQPYGWTYMKAINETMAEISRLDAGGFIHGPDNLPKPWFSLYKDITAIYDAHVKVKLK